MKQCGHCGADISDRPKHSRYCADRECRRQRMLALGRASYRRHRAEVRERQNAAHRARVASRPKPARLCAFCGKDISHKRGAAKWCDLRCRDRARQDSRRAHGWNTYAARVQRNAGLPVDPPLSDAVWSRLIGPGQQCAYCGNEAAEPDHVVPLSRGGRHGPTNIVAACMPCNRSKQDRTPAEWLGRGIDLAL